MGKSTKLLLFTLTIAVMAFLVYIIASLSTKVSLTFDGQKALEAVKFQVMLGPRVFGSDAHEEVATWIISDLRNKGWAAEAQDATFSGIAIKNIIARRGEGDPWIILASHYDSRLYADRDPLIDNRGQPVPGANDGASSVAVLLELARVLPEKLDKQIWLVFFDAEDNAGIPGYDGTLGSKYFVSELSAKPDSVVVLDMVGDTNLNIYMERNSNSVLNDEIWSAAAELDYPQFIPEYKHFISDDHTPFIAAGIRAVDIIDIDYPFWHTAQDTLDKISAESLQAVGDTIFSWVMQEVK